jgi:hypothetical protein
MNAIDKTDLKTYEILLWNVYNTLEDDTKMCVALQKGGKVCDKICKYKYETDGTIVFCCKTHFPKTITIEKKHTYKTKVIKDFPLQEIAKAVIIKLTEIYNENISIFQQVTQILLELQPTLNQAMKLISHIIYGKLIELYMNTDCNIKFVRASHKLKIAYDGPELKCHLKGKYAQRKWLAVQYTRWFLEQHFSEEQKNKWLPFFESQDVKFDMSDCLLMDINGLYGIPKKTKKT